MAGLPAVEAKNTFSYIVMQVMWCLKFCNMTKSGGTIPRSKFWGGDLIYVIYAICHLSYVMSCHIRSKMSGSGRPLVRENFAETDPPPSKTPIFNRFSLVTPQS